jgi:tRNA-modifying protein YgfZ
VLGFGSDLAELARRGSRVKEGNMTNIQAAAIDTSPLEQSPLLFDLSDHDLLEITGRDRVRFLHAMLSNDVQSLAEGEGRWATLNSVEGRTLADVRLLLVGADKREGSLLALLEPGAGAVFEAVLDRYVISEKVFFEAVPDTTLWLVAGEGTDAAVARTGAELPGEAAFDHVATTIGDRAVRVVRLDRSGPVARDLGLLIGGDDVAAVAAALGLEQGEPALLEAARIEAGQPRFGIDITDENVPLEAGLKDRAINFDKGCYIGQEVICRVDSMGSPKRRLCRLDLDGDAAPEPGTALYVGSKEVGRVTSSLLSKRLGPIALGYVRRRNNAPGSELSVGAPDGPRAVVVEAVGD